MSLLALSIPLLVVLEPALSDNLRTVTIQTTGSCLSQEEKDLAIQNITTSIIRNILNTYLEISNNCGPGQWHQVASLNMSDPSQQCPSAWIEYNTDGVRACGIQTSINEGCLGTFYTTSRQYSRVCGRAIGYQVGSTDAFGWDATNKPLDSYYVYGVSITHGFPRNHIWTYAAGCSEGGYSNQALNCPCSKPNHAGNTPAPSFVGNNYYCESGNPTNSWGTFYHLYSGDPLWDGEQCEGECCSNGKSPPWFSVELPNPTTNDIEVRICLGDLEDDSPIHLLELYIQ